MHRVLVACVLLMAICAADCLAPLKNIPEKTLTVKVSESYSLDFSLNPCDDSTMSIAGGVGKQYKFADASYSYSGKNIIMQAKADSQCYNRQYHDMFVHVKFVHDSSETVEGTVTADSDFPTDFCLVSGDTTYKFTWKSSAITGGSSSSWGSAFFLILLIVVILYIGIGIGIKAGMRGIRGPEMIPNIDFYREFPGLLKDGCSFIISKVKKDSGAAYQDI